MRAILLLVFTACLSSIDAQSLFHSALPSGTYAVGYSVLQIEDSTRTYAGRSRLLNTSLWFPAKADGRPIRFKEYLNTEALNTGNIIDDTQLKVLMEQFLSRAIRNGANQKDLESLLQQKVLARSNDTKIDGGFPFVMVLQGGGRPAYTQFILNEWLASYGYIVASFTDLRASADRQLNSSITNALALSKDIQLVLDKLDITERTPKAIIGFSKAGEAILHHQSIHSAFDAMVFLDAQPGHSMINELGLDVLKNNTTPSLAVFSNHQGKMSLKQAQADSIAFGILGGNTLKIRLMEANHGDLTSAAILGDLAPGYNRWKAFGQSRLSHEALCQISFFFLEQYLKNSPKEQEVYALINSLPPGFINMHRIIRK